MINFNYYFQLIFEILNLPAIPQDSPFGKFGYYAEIVFVISLFLLIINLVIKILRRDYFFTSWTTFLFIIVPTSLVMVIVAWFIPEKINDLWPIFQPHM